MDQSDSPVLQWLLSVDQTQTLPSRKRKRGDVPSRASPSALIEPSGPSDLLASLNPRPSSPTDTEVYTGSSGADLEDQKSTSSDLPSQTLAERYADALSAAQTNGPYITHFSNTGLACPPLLEKVLREIRGIINGRPLLWPQLQDEVNQHPLKDSYTLFSLSLPVWYPEPGSSFTPAGPSPTCSQLMDICKEAIQCETRREEIAQWHALVHLPLLRLALSSKNPGLYVTSCMCTAASINPEYQDPEKPPTTYNHRKVDPIIRGRADLVITIDQLNHMHPAIAAIVWSSGSINHSDHPPRDPIAISIVTKTVWWMQQEAELEMATWMAAHFARLHSLVVHHWQGDSDVLWQQAVDELGYLPGILVLGHTWHFVACTWTPPRRDSHNYHGRRSVTLWRSINIGTTDTTEGICVIICVLRHLEAWVETVYWPWFRHWALGDEDEKKDGQQDGKQDGQQDGHQDGHQDDQHDAQQDGQQPSPAAT